MNINEATRALQRAAALRNAGQLEDAADLCQKLVTAFPSVPDPLHLLGLIRKQQGQLREAGALLAESLRLSPGRADWQSNLANLLVARGRKSDAEAAYRAALAVDDGFRPARLALARLLNDLHRHAEAERDARALIANDAGDAEAWVALGVAQRGQENFAEAEEAYRRAIAIAPAYGAAHHNLGALLAERYRPADALDEFDAAAAAGVSGATLGSNRARALIALDRGDEAEALLAGVVRHSPAANDPQTLLAKLRYMRGDADYGRDLHNAVARFPDVIPLQRDYAMLLRGAGRPEAAAEALGDALRRVGRHPHLLVELAGACQDAGDYAAALAAAQEACQLDSREPRFEDPVVDALLSLGRADEALPLIEAARRRAPDNQWHIACEATAARLIGDPRYTWLYDYQRFIFTCELPVPKGWQHLAQFNADLEAVLLARHRYVAAPLDQSLRNGTQTPTSLLGDADPVIRAYLAAVHEPIAQYRAAIGAAADHPLTARNHGPAVLRGAWSVLLRRGGYHVDHVHPEGWLSSAYYVRVPAETGDESMQSGWIRFGQPRYPVPGADAERTIQPRAGLLVLFPSYFWHGTTPISGDDMRLTAPFDVGMPGVAGT